MFERMLYVSNVRGERLERHDVFYCCKRMNMLKCVVENIFFVFCSFVSFYVACKIFSICLKKIMNEVFELKKNIIKNKYFTL